MNRSFPWAFTTGCGVAVLVGIVLILAWQTRRASSMEQEQAVQREVREASWTHERSEREGRLLQASQIEESRREQEFLAAAGGGLAGHLANPRVTLTRTLELISQACLPSHATVTVTVDRFVEFDVLATLGKPARAADLAEWSRCILASSGNLVHSLRFAHQEEIQGSLDRQSIESVTNWNAIADGEVTTLLAGEFDRRNPSITEPVASEDSDVEEVPDSDSARLRMIHREFAQLLVERSRAFTSALNDLIQTSRLAGLGTSQDLQTRKRLSKSLVKRLQDLQPSLMEFADAYEALLDTTRLDPVLRQASLRGARQQLQNANTALETLYRRITEYSVEQEAFFVTLGENWGRWQIEPGGASPRFDSIATASTLGSADRQIAQAAEALRQANDLWITRLRFQ
jgi:hypothetical protein